MPSEFMCNRRLHDSAPDERRHESRAAKRSPSFVVAIVLTVCMSVVLTLNGPPSAQEAQAVSVAGLAVDKQVIVHQAGAASSLSAPALTTSQPDELLLAFIMSDGSTKAKQSFSSVTGGGLTWRLRQRSNAQYGTSEIWQAVASAVVTNAVVTATRGGGSFGGSMVVTAFTGANTAADGATVAAAADTGAPTATLSPTKAGSWVWAAGNDWNRATARTLGTGQNSVDEYLSPSGDTYWVQRQTAASTGGSLVPVTLNDTAPTNDMWNLALIEILPSAVDVVAPSVPTSVQAAAVSPTQVDLSWIASTDDTGVTGYRIARDGIPAGTSVGTSFSNLGLTGSTTYSYTVQATDAAGNASVPSNPVSVTTPAPDTVPPVISTIAASAVSQSSVTVGWTTDEAASGQVQYGLSSAYGSTSTLVSGLTTTHSQMLSGLASGTVYHYRVKSADAAGNIAVSGDSTFTTLAPALDATPPSAAITSPVTGAAVSGTITLTASASDNVGVVGVQFQVDGANSGPEVTSLPYSISWNTATAANGLHGLSAVSRDAAGNSTTSASVTVTVANDTTAPTAVITSPAGGTSVNGTISVLANATDNVGVARVQFLLDGVNLGAADTVAPYSVQWDTSTVANGGHTLSATARDAAGNTGTSVTVSVAVNNLGASNSSAIGEWGSVIPWPEVSIHAALTPSGKILTFQGDFSTGGQQYVYEPTSGVITQVPNSAVDLFCAGQAVLADGRILVLGGTATSGGFGIKAVTAFNSVTQDWETLAPMNHARWYATGTTLGDGRVLTISGSDTSITDLVTIPEIYDPAAGTWADMASSATENLPFYPFMYQLPDGRVLAAGASEVATDTRVLNLQTQTWSVVDNRIIDGSTIANYAPGKFIKAGSAADSGNSGPSANTAFTLDMNQANPSWQPTAPMHYARSFANLTNLPDGTVLVTGGETDKSGYVNGNAVLPAEIWNPATGAWSDQAAMSVPRLYHSVAVLLPDGRVFISGSGGDAGVPDQKNSQIFSPSYLFKGARPTITTAPKTVQYGASTFIQTPDAAGITSVSLTRTGSVTHSFDQNARAMSLPFSQGAGGLNVVMPVDGNTAPPGYYLLSIVNASGVPSVSTFVRFPAPYEDTVAPTAPANLTATGSVGSAALSWTAATDNTSVAGYDVYRSTTIAFTPSAANKVGTTATTSFTDSGLTAGTYYYRVSARDAVGNTGPYSNEAAATATADVTKPTPPLNLTATANGTSITLGWTAATDNVGVTGYQVFRDGAPIGSTTATSFVDGATLAATTYSYSVTAKDAAGNISTASNSVTVTTGAAALPLTVDRTVVFHQSAAAGSISATGVTTSASNELLVAFVSSDGPSSGTQTISGVTGGGLTWRLRQRSNAQPGTSEIWTAVAPTTLSNVTVTATRQTGSYVGSISVVAFQNANLTLDGRTAAGSAATGAPSISLALSNAASWVWGVGNDWDGAITRTVGTNQTKVDEYLAPVGDTFWVQRQTTAGGTVGGQVTLNDTAPTTDRWNFSALEILPAS